MSNISNQSVPEVKGPRNYVQLSDGSDDLAFNENIYITSNNVINPSAIGVDNLQDTCEAGNVTDTDIKCNSLFTDSTGSVNTNTISAVLGTTNVNFSRTYRGDLPVVSLTSPGPINFEYCRGDIVSIRPGTVSGVWGLPTGVAGNHFYFVNSSGNAQRLTGPLGGSLDNLAPPNFINLAGVAPAPFVVKLVCIKAGNWFSSNV